MDTSATGASDPRRHSVDSDLDAFERQALPYLADVARFAHWLTRDAVRAADLVEETFLQALRGWHAFGDGGDAKRWLLTVCHDAFQRTTRREGRDEAAPDDPELESMATARAHRNAQQAGVVAMAERIGLGPVVARALEALPDHCRPAVVLVDLEGQTYEDAARVLDVPVATVRSRLFHGRRLLQDLLFEFARDTGLATT